MPGEKILQKWGDLTCKKQDILCLSKGINSGYLPIGAVLINNTILSAFMEDKGVFEHGSTQAGNIIACASVIAALHEYEKLVHNEDLNRKSSLFYEMLLHKLNNLNCVNNIRYEGFMYSIDICNRSSFPDINKITAIAKELKKNHILVQASELGISLFPMLITSTEQWDYITEKIKKVISKLDF